MANEKEATESTWAERADYHPRDRLLRRHGFRIAARPKNRPAVWTKAGESYTEAEAVMLATAGKGGK